VAVDLSVSQYQNHMKISNQWELALNDHRLITRMFAEELNIM
jgi:hypothetical protein